MEKGLKNKVIKWNNNISMYSLYYNRLSILYIYNYILKVMSKIMRE